MNKVWKQLPFCLYQFDIDRSHRYTDAEITDIIGTMPWRGTSEGWDYLAECAADPSIKAQCERHAWSALRAEEMRAFDEI